MKQIKLVVLILQGLGRGSCLPTVTQQHEEEKPCVLTVPPVFFQAVPLLPEACPGLHIIPPAVTPPSVGEQWCPSATGTLRGACRPASSALHATAQLPARRQHSRWLQLELLCSASRAPHSVQEGCEMPLVALSSASLCAPALFFSACVTVGTGTSIRCVQPGLLPLFQALWELAGGEKPPALRPAVCQVLLLLALLSSSHCTCLSPSQLLFSQPLQT